MFAAARCVDRNVAMKLTVWGDAMPVTLLDPALQPRFVNHLAKSPIIDVRAGGALALTAQQSLASMGLVDPLTGLPLATVVWGYGTDAPSASDPHHPGMGNAGYGGPTILASANVPIQVQWQNALPTDLAGGHLLPLDMSIHMAEAGHGASAPMDHTLIPTVVHLHGAHVAASSDGHPDQWITQDPNVKGTTAQLDTYTYDNSQEAATLWYHDHAMGYTRLNLFAGLAGTYVIEDQNRLNLIAAGALPTTLGAYDTLLMVQDKSFTADGQLYFPGRAADDPLPGTYDPISGLYETVGDGLPADYLARGGTYPTAVPEYYGDFILVNGQAWPHAHVEQSDYLYRMVNGSDSRFFVLQLDNPNVKVTLVGGDGGLMPTARVIMDGDGIQEQGEQLVLAPGDRVELLFDFSKLAVGDAATLLNVGPAMEPFKGMNPDGTLFIAGAATAEDSTGQILQFKVRDNAAATAEFHSTLVDGTVLNAAYVEKLEAAAARTRKLALFEGEDAFGRIHPLLGLAEDSYDINGKVIKAGPLSWEMPITEAPKLGDTEVWEVFNYTEDAHPVHLHLVQYQVLGRYLISETDLDGDGYLNDLGAEIPLYPEDKGNQDTVWVGPGEALKIISTWDRPGEYVWHCHILSHEDHTMMRPLQVINTIDGAARGETLNGTSDIDRISAGKGNDTVNAGDGDDWIVASVRDGNDRYYGGLGADTLDLSAITGDVNVMLEQIVRGRIVATGFASGDQIGADKLYSIENLIGGAGNDQLSGNGEGNYLAGGAGRDVINGLGGDDMIMGGAGNDRLSGGAGADGFIYYRDPNENTFNFGRDTISGFDALSATHDVIMLDNRMWASFDDMMAAGAITQQGRNVVIAYDSDNSITLTGVQLTDLVANAPDVFGFG
jgi:spore coat protein A, manganese oxidase